VNAPVTAQILDEGLSDGNHAVLLSLGLPGFDGFDVQEVVAQHLLGDGGGIAPALLVDQADLAVVGVPGAGRVEVQGEVLRVTQHGGIRMGAVVQRIALGNSAERPQSMRKLLVPRFVGAIVRLFAVPLFRLSLRAVRGLIPSVVGIGVVAFHRRTTMMPILTTLHHRELPQPRSRPSQNLCRTAA
jgi:hypothetical protein